MSDLIDRQAAIDALDGEFNITGRENAETIRDYINGVNKKLRELPSAERTGRWINGNEGNWNAVIVPKCSICGETFYEMNVNINGEYTYNYCPNCGARMDGEEK